MQHALTSFEPLSRSVHCTHSYTALNTINLFFQAICDIPLFSIPNSSSYPHSLPQQRLLYISFHIITFKKVQYSQTDQATTIFCCKSFSHYVHSILCCTPCCTPGLFRGKICGRRAPQSRRTGLSHQQQFKLKLILGKK